MKRAPILAAAALTITTITAPPQAQAATCVTPSWYHWSTSWAPTARLDIQDSTPSIGIPRGEWRSYSATHAKRELGLKMTINRGGTSYTKTWTALDQTGYVDLPTWAKPSCAQSLIKLDVKHWK